MIRRRALCGYVAAGALWAAIAAVAQSAEEGRIHSDFRREWLELHPCREQLQKPCNSFTFGHIMGQVQTLFTGQPLHIAVGSLAPQNGFAGGLAFVEHKDFKSGWRMNVSTDAVASNNKSWRAGAYLKAFHAGSDSSDIVVVNGPGKKQKSFFTAAPLFNVYAETTSLNKLYFNGLGPDTLPGARTAFGMTQTIAGANATVPVGVAGLSLFAEVNGRLPRLRAAPNTDVPSIETAFTEATAPGLSTQPAFVEPAEGVRIQPAIFADHLRLHYLLEFQNYIPAGSSHYMFRRWTADLGHEFPLDKKVHLTAVDEHNSPDSCTPDPKVHCPSPTHVSTAMNHEGSVNLRLLMIGSLANAQGVVPFYLQPTIGGSDINGQAILPSYPDYRFRAPNVVLLRETVEHAIPKIPLGAYFSADEAKVGLRRDDINFTNLKTSYSAGITVHAGGLPVVYLLFAWGGGEGHHTIFNVSNALLGGSARPSLF